VIAQSVQRVRYGVEICKIMVRFPEGTKGVSLHRIHTGSEAHKTSHPMGAGDRCPGGEADHSSPCTAKIKNGKDLPPSRHVFKNSKKGKAIPVTDRGGP
jgi:hypothetical protein